MNGFVKALLIAGGGFALWEWVVAPMLAAQTPAATPAPAPTSTTGATGVTTPAPSAVSPTQPQPQNTPPPVNRSGYIPSNMPDPTLAAAAMYAHIARGYIMRDGVVDPLQNGQPGPNGYPIFGLPGAINQPRQISGALGNYRYSPATRTPYFAGSGRKLMGRG